MIALILYCFILAFKAVLGGWYAYRYPAPRRTPAQDLVTVCQPILSGDPDLETALRDNLTALPMAQFIWLIDERDRTAADVTSRLAGQYPERSIKVIACPEPPEGVNPKLFKLERARAAVPLGVFLVLDDDTRLSQITLDALCQALEQSELVTGLPFYREAANVFGNLLAQFVNNNSALAYLPLLTFAPPLSINGMGYAAQVGTLERLGGFSPSLRHLTDDLAVARQVTQSGGRIIQVPYPMWVATTIGSLSQYVAQMHRWYIFALLLMRQLTFTMNLVISFLAALPPILLLVGVAVVARWPSLAALAWLLGTLSFRSGVLCLLQRRLSGQTRHRIGLSLLSEVLQPLHLTHAMVSKTIRWRTRRYRVYDNDHFVSR